MTAKRYSPQPGKLLAAVAFPPTSFEKKELTAFNSSVCNLYDYSQFIFTNPGARIADTNGNEIAVLPDRIIVNEIIGLTFESSKQKCVDIIKNQFFGTFAEKFKAKPALGYGIKLVSITKSSSNEVSPADFILRNLRISTDQLRLLGNENIRSGLRFNFVKTNNERQCETDIRIEPFLADTTKLWIELDINFPNCPLDSVLSNLESDIQNTRQYLISDIADFIEHLNR